MSTETDQTRVGSIGCVRDGKWTIAVTILDWKRVYGRSRFLVRQTSGGPSYWVAAERLEFNDPPAAPATSNTP